MSNMFGWDCLIWIYRIYWLNHLLKWSNLLMSAGFLMSESSVLLPKTVLIQDLSGWFEWILKSHQNKKWRQHKFVGRYPVYHATRATSNVSWRGYGTKALLRLASNRRRFVNGPRVSFLVRVRRGQRPEGRGRAATVRWFMFLGTTVGSLLEEEVS